MPIQNLKTTLYNKWNFSYFKNINPFLRLLNFVLFNGGNSIIKYSEDLLAEKVFRYFR